MHSLSELRDFLKSKEIEVKDFNGWMLKVGVDVWTMHNDVYLLNGAPYNMKDKTIFETYTKVNHVRDQGVKTRKWRGASCRRIVGVDGNRTIQESTSSDSSENQDG